MMPGGKGKIRPEDGKQFSSTYQPQEKWTEPVALEVGKALIKWMKEKDENIFFDEFLYIENDYYSELISYLCEKFTSFSKLIAKAKKIQEIKLKKFGTADVLNASITKFVLINEHDWRDKQETQLSGEVKGQTQIIVSSQKAANALGKILDGND